MYLIFLFFTLFCRGGIIYDCPEPGHYSAEVRLDFSELKTYYYYWNMEEFLPDGSYLYVSNTKDSVWFYVEQKNAYYTLKDSSANSEMDIYNDQ